MFLIYDLQMYKITIDSTKNTSIIVTCRGLLVVSFSLAKIHIPLESASTLRPIFALWQSFVYILLVLCANFGKLHGILKSLDDNCPFVYKEVA